MKIMTDLPIILDGIIEEELQNQIEDAMFDCKWQFTMDNSLGSKFLGMEYRKFLNPFEYEISPSIISSMSPIKNNKIYNKISPVIKKGCDEIKFNIEKIERCFGAIHTLIRKKSKIDIIHINREIPHLVMLYYVNDCDGDTILYDKSVEDIPKKFLIYPSSVECPNIIHRITPKRGRILFFDGRTYHAPSTPTTGIRCIITLDLFGEFKDGSYKFPAPKEKITNTIKYQ